MSIINYLFGNLLLIFIGMLMTVLSIGSEDLLPEEQLAVLIFLVLLVILGIGGRMAG